MTKLLLLDLDNTVRETISGATFINDPFDQRLILGAAETIARYKSQFWQIIGISNQGGETCWEVSASGGEFFQKQDGEPGFRKPEPGMIQLAIARIADSLEEPVSECLYVGDREEDLLAAQAAGIPFQWAHIWRGDRA